MTIKEVNDAAKAAGMSYGQYVDKHKEDQSAEDLASTRICARCGKAFTAEGKAHSKRYCSDRCRELANEDRRKEKKQSEARARLSQDFQTLTTRQGSVRERILAEAQEIYEGNRQGQYGNRERNFEMIAGLWSAYLGSEVTPGQVASMMALLKVARMRSGHYKTDNYVDAVNYLLFAAELEEGCDGQAD